MVHNTLVTLAPGQRLAAARAAAGEIMPYFRAGIQSLVPREMPELGTLGVTDESILLVDYAVLGSFTAKEAGAVLLHEYLHIYLKHTLRYEALLKTGALTESDRGDFNRAADCEINDNLIEAGCTLPKLGGLDPCTPVSLGLTPHRTAEEYVAELLKRKQKGKGGSQGQPPPPGWGQCGSGAGNPLPGEPEKGDAEGRTEIEQHMQRRQDSGQIQQAARSKSQGNVPAGLVLAANAMLKPAEVRWQDKLSRAVRSAVTFINGQGDFTFTVRSRMQGPLEMMLGEDAPVLPGEHAPRAEVLIAEDTSGSMGRAQAHKVREEVASILRHMGGAKATYVSIDCSIHTVQRVGKIGEIKARGGGGTDFRPIFDALPTFRPRPQIVIFCTDGYGPAPEAPPKGVHTIWLVIDGISPCKWGEHIHVKTSASAADDDEDAA